MPETPTTSAALEIREGRVWLDHRLVSNADIYVSPGGSVSVSNAEVRSE